MPIYAADRRRELPDEPGVYLFHDAKGKVIYVGKAVSIKKRIASHYSNPSTSAGHALLPLIETIEALVVRTEAEALLVEQNFIKQYQPRFNIRLRDDKSYPYIGISLDEDFPRVYFTRERHRRDRAYFGPYSTAKRVRATLDVLTKVFMYRSCEGATPGRRSGSPCLDYYIKRCEAPCVGYVSREQYREAIDGVMAFLSGRYKEIERRLQFEMQQAAAEQRYEDAARERNRLTAVRQLLERQRVVRDEGDTFDALAVAVADNDANVQVFQVRDGILSDRQSFYLDNTAGSERGDVIEAFILQYYGSAMAIPPLVVVQHDVGEVSGRRAVDAQGGREVDIPGGPEVDVQGGREVDASGSPEVDAGTRLAALSAALSERRSGRCEVRAAERGDKRRILELAERNALLALDQEKLRAERSRQQRTEALDHLQRELGMEALPMRIECYDISTLMGTNTVASMVVFEGGAPKKSDYRRFKVQLDLSEGPNDFASMNEILGRRIARFEQQRDISPHAKDHDASFAALPNLIVIDGGKGQLSAGLDALQPFVDRGVTVVSLAKRIEEVFIPGRERSLVLPHDTVELQLLQRVRDEAHRFAITHHRQRRDARLTSSILDGLPGIGPTRKRALLTHFGSPDAVLSASREELEAVPGISGKLARDLHRELHKTGI